MGSVLEKIFIDPKQLEDQPCALLKILFLMAAYGFVLFKASNLISDGSELLLLIPSVAGIVGSVVLPVLGAVPDGMIVLFSGLGPREEAQEQLSVGVGALAGSTIMLLTVPWFFSLLAGRVSLDENGTGAYRKKEKLVPPRWSLWRTGTNVKPGLRISALIMIITSVSYLLIQGPAFSYSRRGTETGSGSSSSDASDDSEVRREHYWALAGFVMSLIMFVGYLAYQVLTANKESNKDRIAQVQHDAVSKSLMSLSAVFAEQLFTDVAPSERSALLLRHETSARFDALLREFFNRHDIDGNGVVDATEMRSLLADLGEHPTKEEFDRLMLQMDANRDGVIQYDEFHASMKAYVKHLFDKDNGLSVPISVVVSSGDDQPAAAPAAAAATTTTTTEKDGAAKARSVKSVNSEDEAAAAAGSDEEAEDDEDDEEEEEEVPDDLTHLPPKKQRMRIVLRACWMMGLGVLLVIVFSDPMVDVFSSLGNVVGIDSFYIAFTLAPLASNASELIAAINYARKKTVRTATIGCESLIGAACMNNTFCLSIFLLLVFVRGLAWRFSAETLSIIAVELAMLGFAVQRTQRLLYGFLIILLYPLSIGFVVFLEKVVHWN